MPLPFPGVGSVASFCSRQKQNVLLLGNWGAVGCGQPALGSPEAGITRCLSLVSTPQGDMGATGPVGAPGPRGEKGDSVSDWGGRRIPGTWSALAPWWALGTEPHAALGMKSGLFSMGSGGPWAWPQP